MNKKTKTIDLQKDDVNNQKLHTEQVVEEVKEQLPETIDEDIVQCPVIEPDGNIKEELEYRPWINDAYINNESNKQSPQTNDVNDSCECTTCVLCSLYKAIINFFKKIFS